MNDDEAVEVFRKEYRLCFPRGGDHADHDDAVRQAVEAVVMRVRAEPAWCPVHQHHDWCEHNGGAQGANGWEAPDRACPECLRLREDLERQKQLTIQWARDADRLRREDEDA